MLHAMRHHLLVLLLLPGIALAGEAIPDPVQQALANGRLANEGYRRCIRYRDAWLQEADPVTGLLPRNRKDRYWNGRDAAADNWPFMVMTCALLDRPMFEGRMKDMLATERRVTARLGRLPDTWVFATQAFRNREPQLLESIFDGAEYVKDGLLPLTDWLGPSPWSERMVGIIDDSWERATIPGDAGLLVSDDIEVIGDHLQALSRLYWFTGRQEKYLDWAIRIGDHHLLGNHHPTRDSASLRLRDHGCEIVCGLCELYVTCHFARPAKREAYRKPLYAMLDRILEIGRNADGLFYDAVDPRSGTVLKRGIADNWGYTYNGYYAVHLVDNVPRYRDETVRALEVLDGKYRSFPWEGTSADGYADAIEGAINLVNREPVASAMRWIDSEIRVLWGKQQDSGIIEGWHGDGNFARTTIMYGLWKTQGATIQPWRADVVFGAVRTGEGGLLAAFTAGRDWEGVLRCDAPRHRTAMGMPLDWPRINQWQEWFTVEAGRSYQVVLPDGAQRVCDGADLLAGLPVRLVAGQPAVVRVAPMPRL